MSRASARRRKGGRLYDIAIVSLGEGRRTRTFRASARKLLALGALAFLACVAVTIAVLVFTPVALYVPIPNPGLEARYGRQIVETQERLAALAQDVLILRDYNLQLRKALGERVPGDTSAGASRQDPRTAAASDTPPADSMVLASGDDLLEIDGADAPRGGGSVLFTTGAAPAGPTRFPLMMPTSGYVSQGFDPANGHLGLDIAGRRGTPVVAPADGRVVFAGYTYDDGNMMMLSHSGGYLTVFKHTQALLRGTQARVQRGEAIALLGSSGRTSLGPHLHFEVWEDGVPVDPRTLMLGTTPIP